MKRKLYPTRSDKKNLRKLNEIFSENEQLIPIFPEGYLYESINSLILCRDFTSAKATFYGYSLKFYEELFEKKPQDFNKIIFQLRETIHVVSQFFSIIYHEESVKIIFKILNNKSADSSMAKEIEFSLIKTLEIFIKLEKCDHLIKHFLEIPNLWMMEAFSAEFVVNVARKIGTNFPSTEIIQLINRSKLSMLGLHCRFDGVCDNWFACKAIPCILIDDTVLVNSQFYKKNCDTSIVHNHMEEYLANEIFLMIVCCGSCAFRSIAPQKIPFWLNNARLIKIIMQFIATLVTNFTLNQCPEDIECLIFLLRLKLKSIYEQLIIHFVKCHLVQIPDEIFVFINSMIFPAHELEDQFYTLTVNMVRELVDVIPDHTFAVLSDLWYKYMNQDKIKCFIDNVLRPLDNSNLYSIFFSIIFKKFPQIENLDPCIFFKFCAESICLCFIQTYYDSAIKKSCLPSYSNKWSQKKIYIIDERIIKSVQEIQLMYLHWVDEYFSTSPPDILSNFKIIESLCNSFRKFLFLYPLDTYMPIGELSRTEFDNYDFIKNQLMYLLFYGSNDTLLHLLKIIHSRRLSFFQHDIVVIDLFSTIFDFFLDNIASFMENVHNLVNLLVQNEFMGKIWDITSLSIPDFDFRLVKIASFFELSRLYLKLFIISPNIIGPIIFERFPTIKYLILVLIFPQINLSSFSDLEGSFTMSREMHLEIMSTKFPNFLPTIYLVLNIHQDVPVIRVELMNELYEFCQNSSIKSMLLEESSFFRNYLERVWRNSLSKRFEEPRNMFSCFVFVPNLLSEAYIKVDKFPPVLLLIYLYMNYLVIFFRPNKSLIQQIIDYLYNMDFDVSILPFLELGFVNEFIAYPSLILFFLLTSKSKKEYEYLTNSDYLDYYVFEKRYNYLKENIIAILKSSLYFEFSSTRFKIFLKIMKVVPSSRYIQILLTWVLEKFDLVLSISKDDPLCVEHIFSILLSNWVDPCVTHHIYSLQLLLSLSLHNNPRSYTEYSLLRDKISVISKSVFFDFDFLKTCPNYGYILDFSDTLLVKIFLNCVVFSENFPKKVSQLFHFLQLGSYSSSTVSIVLKMIDNALLYNLGSNPIDINCWNKVELASFAKVDHPLLANIFHRLNIQLPNSSEFILKNTPVLFNPVNEQSLHYQFFDSDEMKLNSSNQRDLTIFSDKSNPDIVNINFNPFIFQNKSNISSCLLNYISSSSEEIFELSNSFRYNQIIELMSPIDLVRLLSNFTEFSAKCLEKNCSKILCLISSASKHAQLFHGDRLVNEKINIVPSNIPNDHKFNEMLLKCLLYETFRENLENICSRLIERTIFWSHIDKNFNYQEITAIFSSLAGITEFISELNPSVQIVLVFLHLNNPSIFYDYIYDTSNLSCIYEVVLKITYSLNDEFLMKTLKNCVDCLSRESSSSSTIYRLLVLCKIIRLYPLHLVRHISYFLSGLIINLKTCLFSSDSLQHTTDISSFSSSKMENLLIVVDIVKLLSENNIILKNHDLLLFSKINRFIEAIMIKINEDENPIKSNQIDALVMAFECMAIEKPTKLSIYEVAFWFFNVPLQNISQLRKYMHNLGSIIYQNFINTDSKITFFENYLPLILVLTKIWQQKLIDDLICEDYSNILNICGMAYPTNTVDCGSFIEDYFHLFSTVF